MDHVPPVQRTSRTNNSLYDLDGNDVYSKVTGNTEADIEEISFKEVLNKLLEEEKK